MVEYSLAGGVVVGVDAVEGVLPVWESSVNFVVVMGAGKGGDILSFDSFFIYL